MTEPVHIKVFCRKPELLPAATLVFKTIRVGFPDAPICVHLDGNNYRYPEIVRAVDAAAARSLINSDYESHDGWIDNLILNARCPFWICDTDVVFWKRFQHKPDGSALAGVRIPSFYEPWTRTQHRERLHPCLMRIDPERFLEECVKFRGNFPAEPFKPRIDFVSQQLQAERVHGALMLHFYDTLAMAWHAFGGQEFTQEQIESFDHLNCATYADLIAPSLDFDMLGAHKAIYENIENARGSWALQFQWFAKHKV